MMKRFFSLFLVLLLALPCAAACAESSDWDLAYSLMEKYTGYSRDQVRPGQLLYEDGMLSFSVVLKDHPEDEDGLLVFEMDGQNNLVSLEGPEKISLEQQLVAALKECFNREDCWQRLAGVHEKWSRKLSRENLSDLSPSPLLVKLEYSHPTLSQRIDALEKLREKA